MATSVSLPRSASPAIASEGAIPWYVWLSVIGVTSAIMGVHWDISWHRSIGRDSFWTPAHIAIQLCGVIAGITCGYLILSTTFTNSPLRAESVSVAGFRAPLGAFICAWGGFTMITSAPFDDWWHNAYGLDVKILSPPHVVLALGMLAVETGALVLIAARMNRSKLSERRRLEQLFLYLSGMILIALLVLILEFTGRVYLHTAACYRAVALLTPFVLTFAARATGARWAATTVAAIYTAFLLGFLWILPIFPAQPKLGPVLHEVTHFVPNGFPLLLIGPAMALDAVWPRISAWKMWVQAVLCGVVFLAVFVAIEWPFAAFLQSPAARNPIFGSSYFDYSQNPQGWSVNYQFAPIETVSQFRIGMLAALVCAMLSSWLGLGAGKWLASVRR